MPLRRERRVAVVAALAGVSVIALSGVAFREQVVEWWYRHERIPVVRTWQDLLRTEPIDLGGGATARVGMEARRCPAGTGVLLYCVTEGWEPAGDASWQRWALGPLVLKKEVTSQIGPRLLNRVLPDARHLWFAAGIPVDRLGTVRVALQSRDGEPLRSAIVEGTAVPVHDWVPFGSPLTPERLRGRNVTSEWIPEVRVSIGTGSVLPFWDGAEPFLVEAGDPPSGELPRFLPDTPDPGFQLEAEEGGLLVRADEPLPWHRAHEHFLARWWVNGDPASTPPNGTSAIHRGRIGPEPTPSSKLRLRLDFDPAGLGALPGDRIGVQLLYSGSGWSFRSLEELFPAPWLNDSGRVRMTNRVEFVAWSVR